MPIKVIARVMKVSRNTVRAAIGSDRPPRYERPAKGSIVDAAEPRVGGWGGGCRGGGGGGIAGGVGGGGWVGVLGAGGGGLRRGYLPRDPGSGTAYEGGEIAQCDLWFPPVMVPVGCGQVRK